MPTAIRAAILFAVTLALFYVLWPLIWIFVLPSAVPPLSPILALMNGLPTDTRYSHSWKDGAYWRYCRSLPSGRAVFTSHGLILEYGQRCGTIPRWYRPATSLERPGLWVSSGGWIQFAVPEWPGFGASRPCPYKLSPAYLGRANALLIETLKLPDLDESHGQDLKDAAASLASFSGEWLRAGGKASNTYFCDLEPPGRHANLR